MSNTANYDSGKQTLSSKSVASKQGKSAFSARAKAAIRLVDEDYVEAAIKLGNDAQRADKAARESLYIAAGAAYRLAERLHVDDELWEEFQEDEFWEKHSKLDHAYCLRYALMYVYGGHGGLIAERARDHARALDSSWNAGEKAIEIPRLLQGKGGFDGLRKEASRSSSEENDRESDDDKPASMTLTVPRKRVQRFMRLHKGEVIYVRLKVTGLGKSGPIMEVTGTTSHWTPGDNAAAAEKD